jgi:hypothetical protein
MTKEAGPYILVSDDSGHHYVIPNGREEHWNAWIGSTQWEDGEIPAYAEAIGGSPTRVVFESYIIQ